MGEEHPTIVIGEALGAHSGVVRSVLQGEGFDVAAQANNIEELSVAIAAYEPDVIVLDDALGVTGMELASREIPNAKIVFIWPPGVQAVGADARIDPDNIVDELGSVVQRLTGVQRSTPAAMNPPEWVGRVRKDPARLRERLMARGATSSSPGIAELQQASRQRAEKERPARWDRSDVAASAQPVQVPPEHVPPEVVEVPEVVLADIGIATPGDAHGISFGWGNGHPSRDTTPAHPHKS